MAVDVGMVAAGCSRPDASGAVKRVFILPHTNVPTRRRVRTAILLDFVDGLQLVFSGLEERVETGLRGVFHPRPADTAS